MRTIGCISMGVVVFCVLSIASAQTIPVQLFTNWQHDPVLPGSWFDANNWSLGLPTPTLGAAIQNGGTAIIGLNITDTLPAQAAFLNLGGTMSGTLFQRQGSLAVTGKISLGSVTNYLSPLVSADLIYYPPQMAPGRFDVSGGTVKAADICINSSYGRYPLYSSDIVAGPGSLMQQLGGTVTSENSVTISGGACPIYTGPVPLNSSGMPVAWPVYGSTYNLAGGILGRLRCA